MSKDCSMKEISEKLRAPFSTNDVEWRVSRSGISNNGKQWAMVLAYVTNRAIQNRLDEVFGPSGWKNDFRDFMQGILCTITCYVDGEWISKSDGAELTQFESLKGGLSGAMKRAAVQWSIGRYLYNIDEIYVEVTQTKGNNAKYISDKKTDVKGYWIPPKLPDWALPENEKNQGSNSRTSNQSQIQAKQKEFNRAGAVTAIGEFIKNTGLNKQKGWIMPLFKKINPKITQTTLEEVYESATEAELKRYYSVLRPVNDLCHLVNYHMISMEDALSYVQILCPEIKIESLFSCFMHLTGEHVKEIHAFVKEDLSNGQIKKIA